VGAAIIIIVPGIELVMTFTGKDQAMIKTGEKLTVNINTPTNGARNTIEAI